MDKFEEDNTPGSETGFPPAYENHVGSSSQHAGIQVPEQFTAFTPYPSASQNFGAQILEQIGAQTLQQIGAQVLQQIKAQNEQPSQPQGTESHQEGSGVNFEYDCSPWWVVVVIIVFFAIFFFLLNIDKFV